MSYSDILRQSNFTNLPTDPISATTGTYNIAWTLLSSANDVETIDYESDTNYYGSSSEEEANWRLVRSEIVDGLLMVFKDASAAVDNYSVYFGDISNVAFTPEVNGGIAIGENDGTSNLYIDNNDAAVAYNYVSGVMESEGKHGDIWFNEDYNGGWSDADTKGTEAFLIVLHEAAHALGLKHPTNNENWDSQKYTIIELLPNPWTISGVI